MAGARQKDPALLVNRRGGRGRGLTVLARPDAFIAPPAPEGIGAAGKRAWVAFWKSDVSAAVDIEADREDLEDWAWCVDERAKLRAVIGKHRLIEAKEGLKRNPLTIDLRDLSDRIQRYSDRFGMNPTARFRLQFSVSEAGKSASDLMKMLSEETERPDVIDLDAL